MTEENSLQQQERFAFLRKKAEEIPFYQFLGMRLTELDTGHAVIELATREEYGNINQTMHGGIMMSAADAAMATAVRTLGYQTTTIQLDICFMRGGQVGKPVRAEGNVVKAGHRIVFCECKIFCEAQEIALVKGTFFRTGDL